jgi:hypothetical protein
MWHMLQKVPEKVGPDLKEDDDFHASLSLCVWSSETPEEFEDRWARIIIQYGLKDHEWFAGRFDIDHHGYQPTLEIFLCQGF